MNQELGDAYAYVERFRLTPMSTITWAQFAKWLRANARIMEIQSESSPARYEARPLYEWLEEIR